MPTNSPPSNLRMSSFRGQQHHYRHFDPGGSPTSSPPSTTSRDRAWRNRSSPRSRRLSGLASSPSNQPVLYEPDAWPVIASNLDTASFLHGNPAGSFSYFCGWDSISRRDQFHNVHTDNVLLIGSEGCLDTYIITDTKLTDYGRLENLPGAVIDARILPQLDGRSSSKTQNVDPYVVLVIHGPKFAPNATNDPARYTVEDRITNYQTSVELYALQNGEHISTLFRTKPVDLDEPFGAKRFMPPPPQGDLRIEVQGQFVLVASGMSGEIWLFGHERDCYDQSDMPYRCLVKLWTSIQAACPSTSSESISPTKQSGRPILSLSHRWLALVPPSSASTIDGEIPSALEEHMKPPGFNSYVPPEKPVENCVIDAPDVDTLLDRASKYIVQNSKALGEKSREAWNNYWSSPQQRPTFSNPMHHLDTTIPETDKFPPTHGFGNAHTVSNREPTLVAIYDMEKLIEHVSAEACRHTMKPLATFAAPLGCSFLSFSPDGRYLMTVSDKGEYQFVWHCFALANTQASWALRPDYDGVLKEVARFSRNTEANIVDVVWKSPLGEVVAILTGKGTIHVHVLPAHATDWPFGARTYALRKGSDSDSNSHRPGSSDWASTALTNAKFAFGSLSSAARRSSSSEGSPVNRPSNFYTSIGSTIGSVASSGGRFVAKGVSSGYGLASDTLTHVRHMGENKIYLATSSLVHPSPRRIRFVDGVHGSNLINVIEEGRSVAYPYRIEDMLSSRKTASSPRIVAIDTDSPLRISIASIPELPYPPVFSALLDNLFAVEANVADFKLDGPLDEPLAEPPHLSLPISKATLGTTTKPGTVRRASSVEEWRAAAEISSIARKTPFHRQPGVRFFVFEEGRSAGSDYEALPEEEDYGLEATDDGGERWVFGGELGGQRRVKVGRMAAAAVGGREEKRDEEEGWEQVK